MVNLSSDFWKSKKVLVTGHTGFKGSWLVLWLKALGCKVAGYALAPNTKPSLFEAANIGKVLDLDLTADIRDAGKMAGAVKEFKPDIVIHMAAQALVQASFKNPTETWATNVMGTLSVLEAVRGAAGVKCLAVVTTDKCYWNDGQGPFKESDPLGGKDPYSASKAGTEMVVASHFHTFFKNEMPGMAVVTLRAGNIIGGGDWAEDRLVPDIVRSVMDKKSLTIRMPESVRPWQYVLDALKGYLLAIENAKAGSLEHFNFAPPANPKIPVKQILASAQKTFPHLKWTSPSKAETREAATLTLDAGKAAKTLGWKTEAGAEELIERTLKWYEQYYKKQDARQLCQAEIESYL